MTLPSRSRTRTITVGAVMHRGVISCPSQMPMGGVAALMAEHGVHCVVVDGAKVAPRSHERLARDFVTDVDLMRATGSGRLDAEAGEATANQIVTVSSDENIERAAQIMSAFSTAEERHTLGGAIIDELFMEGEDPLLEIDLQTEISDEDPVTALIEAAHRHGARGIIVGCEQHSRLQKAFGTVTSELLKTSPVPVTAVPFHDSTDTARATT